jgi:hypothetical protein
LRFRNWGDFNSGSKYVPFLSALMIIHPHTPLLFWIYRNALTRNCYIFLHSRLQVLKTSVHAVDYLQWRRGLAQKINFCLLTLNGI